MGARAKRLFGFFAFEVGAAFYGWLTAQAAWRRHCAELAEPLPAHARHIVDLGCGPGVSTFELARARPNAHVVGFDLAARMLAEAKARSGQSGVDGRAQWLRGDAHELPFRQGSVDGMTGHSFLYLLPEPARALKEIRRCLRPGGRLVLMEPQRSGGATFKGVMGLSRDARFLMAMALWRPISRAQGQYTPERLRQALEEAGLTVVQLRPTLAGLGLLAVAQRPEI